MEYPIICYPFCEYLGPENFRAFGCYWDFYKIKDGRKAFRQPVVTNATYFV